MAELPAVDTTVREGLYESHRLTQQDLDRNFGLPVATILRWMQAPRQALPWIGPIYRDLARVEPVMPRRLLVASQIVRLVEPGILRHADNQEVKVQLEIGYIGNTSIEFRYRVYYEARLVARACTTMIVVSGVPGSFKPSPVPDVLRPLASADPGEDRLFLASSLESVPKTPPPGALTTPATIRFSDEDINKHAHHPTMAHLFEEAREVALADADAPAELKRIAGQKLAAVLISYHAESRAMDECEVAVAVSSIPDALDLWVMRKRANRAGGQPGLISRGRLVFGGGGSTDSRL